jgi:hypothetical protein
VNSSYCIDKLRLILLLHLLTHPSLETPLHGSETESEVSLSKETPI